MRYRDAWNNQVVEADALYHVLAKAVWDHKHQLLNTEARARQLQHELDPLLVDIANCRAAIAELEAELAKRPDNRKVVV